MFGISWPTYIERLRQGTVKLQRIAQAIAEGHKQQRLLDGDLNELRKALGMVKPKEEEVSAKQRATSETRPGQRRLVRDRVGTRDAESEVAA